MRLFGTLFASVREAFDIFTVRKYITIAVHECYIFEAWHTKVPANMMLQGIQCNTYWIMQLRGFWPQPSARLGEHLVLHPPPSPYHCRELTPMQIHWAVHGLAYANSSYAYVFSDVLAAGWGWKRPAENNSILRKECEMREWPWH